MFKRYIISKSKKNAFSYMELIIAMTLAVIVIMLSTPFIVSIPKGNISPYGEFICYARYVNGEWRLFQNERINADTFPLVDKEVNVEEGCTFNKPNNVTSYTITIYGGGGSGSSPYFESVDANNIYIAKSQNGYQGEQKTITDNLSFKGDSVLQIKLCENNFSEYEICVGKGGEINQYYDRSYAKKERIEKIIIGLSSNILNESDNNYLHNSYLTQSILDSLAVYNNNRTQENADNLINELNIYIHQPLNQYEQGKNSGLSGIKTQIKLSSGSFLIANGGKYGLSDVNMNYTALNKSNMTTIDNEIYYNSDYFYTSRDKAPEATFDGFINCDGIDGNEMINTDKYTNYGKEGRAGAFICKLGNENNYSIVRHPDKNLNTVSNNSCHCCLGGRGAGGAIKIQWN